MPARARARSTSHCLIVAHTGIAQGHIVHAALIEADKIIWLVGASTPTALFPSSPQTCVHFSLLHLGGCTGPKSPQNDIHYSLRCEHVASNHCCLWGWIQYGAFGNYNMHRSQATLVNDRGS